MHSPTAKPAVLSEQLSADQVTKPTRSIDNEYEDAEKNYKPKSIKFWSIMIGVYLSMFIVALDRTIIATAIPKITDEFDSIKDIGWYGSAYMLAAACLFPISGRIYQLYSTKWVFLGSLIVFEVGSTLCAAAPSSIVFIIGRAVAGLSSAGIFTGSMMVSNIPPLGILNILGNVQTNQERQDNSNIMWVDYPPTHPLRKRPVYTSILGLASGVATVLGPIMGGALTRITWRWCFYINLPIGGFTILAVLFFLHIPSPTHEKLTIFAQVKNLDPVGIIFLVPSMVCLILALQWGGSTLSWSAPKIIGLLVAFAVLLIIFIGVEVLMPKTAMIPARVVLNRSVAGSMGFMFLNSGGMMAIVYYLSIWFQAVKGNSAMHAGVSSIPLLLSMIVMSIPTAVLTQKIGYYVPALLLAPIFCAVGAGMISTLAPNSDHNQSLYGFGLGLGFQTSTLAPQTVLQRSDVPIGMAMMFFMQQLGGSIFLSVSQNLFTSKLVQCLSGVAGLDAEAIVNSGATNLRDVVPASQLGTVIAAYNYSLTRVFVMAAALSACMILGAAAVEWRSIKGKKVGDGEGFAKE